MALIEKLDLGSILTGLGALSKDFRSATTGEIDPQKKAEIELKIIEIENQLLISQNKINEEEAKSTNLFVSCWRPFIGWMCGITLFYHYILSPIISWITGSIPLKIDISELYPILLGLLGLGTLRTVEKLNGKTK